MDEEEKYKEEKLRKRGDRQKMAGSGRELVDGWQLKTFLLMPKTCL